MSWIVIFTLTILIITAISCRGASLTRRQVTQNSSHQESDDEIDDETEIAEELAEEIMIDKLFRRYM